MWNTTIFSWRNSLSIISKELYFEYQAIRIIKRKAQESNETYVNKGEFRGLLKCEICGHSYVHKNGPYKEYWICTTVTRMGKAECSSKQVPDTQLKTAVCEALGILFSIKLFYIKD